MRVEEVRARQGGHAFPRTRETRHVHHAHRHPWPDTPLRHLQALAVCDYLQKELVAGGKLISPNIATIHAAIKDGTHDLDCPYLWDDKPGYAGYPDSVAGMPEYLKAKIHAKKKNIGKSVSCKVVVGGCDGGTCG